MKNKHTQHKNIHKGVVFKNKQISNVLKNVFSCFKCIIVDAQLKQIYCQVQNVTKSEGGGHNIQNVHTDFCKFCKKYVLNFGKNCYMSNTKCPAIMHIILWSCKL